MTWRDRATVVDDAQQSNKGWRSRAIQDVQGPPSDKPGVGESFATGAMQGSTLGFGDEAIAAMDATGFSDPKRGNFSIPGAVMDVVGQIAMGENPVDKYRSTLDYVRNRMAQGHKAHPWAFNTGNVAGSLATAPIIPAAAGWGGAAKTGAALGAIQGLGGSNADLTKGDIGGAVKDAEIGGVLGGVLGTIGYGVGSLLGNAKDIAQTRGAKALGYTKRLLKTPEAVESAKNTAQEMLDRGVITPMASPTEMADRVGDLLDSSGQSIGKYLKSVNGGFDTRSAIDAVNALRPTGSDGQWLRGGNYDAVNGLLDKALDTIQAHKDVIPFEEANKLKGLLQGAINWRGTNLESEVGRQIAGAMRNSVDSNLERIAGDAGRNGFDQFLKDKSTYSSALNAQDALANRISSEFGNKTIGLTDAIWGAGELAAGNPGGAAAAIAGKRVLERYGNQAGAWAADKVAKLVQTSPQVFGKFAPALTAAAARGANALATTQFILSKREPEFQEIMKKIGGNQDEH